jgi:hypothetical protein
MSPPRRALVAVLLPKKIRDERVDLLLQLLRRDYQVIEATSPAELLGNVPVRRLQALLIAGSIFLENPPGLLELTNQVSRRVLLVREQEGNQLSEALASNPGLSLLPLDRPLEPLLGDLRQLVSPRHSVRLALPGLKVSFPLEEETGCFPLIDISNEGCAFVVRAGVAAGRLLPGSSLPSFRIQREDAAVLVVPGAVVRSLQVLPRDPANPGDELSYKVGVQYVHPVPATGAGHEQKIEDPMRVRALIDEALGLGAVHLGLLDDPMIPVPAESLRFHDAKRLVARVALPPNVEVGDLAQATFELHDTSYKFTVAIMGVSEGQGVRGFYLKAPRMLVATRRRRSARFRPTREQLIGVDVESPFGGVLDSRPVVNLTTLGLAFQLGRHEVVPVGTILPRVRLRFPDGTELTTRARVRSLSFHGAGLKCGVEFDTVSPTERARLADAIVHAGQPEVVGVTGRSFQDVWDLFVRSGFLYPEKRKSLDEAAVERTLNTLQAAPNGLFKGSLFARDGQPYAHISAVRAYRKAWIIHHLAATAPGRQRVSLARLLNLAIIEYLEQQPDIEWIRVYYRPENPWPAKTLGSFAKRVSDSSLSSHRILHYVRGATRGQIVPADKPGLRIRAAEVADLQEVEAYFVSRRDNIALKAEDLCAPHLLMSGIAQQYEALGLERRREILIAERHGTINGFALLEISSPGLNLSELTSSFRVFLRRPDSEARLALIAASRARYAQLGRSVAVALAESHELTAFTEAGMDATKRYATWTWHRSLYRQFFEYILGGLQKERARGEISALPHGEPERVAAPGTEDRRPRIVA